MDQIDESKRPALVKATKAAGTWQVPTEALLDNMTGSDDPEAMAKWPEMKYMPAEQIQKWIAQKQGLMTQYPAATRDKFIALRRKILKALYDGGVPFALGSDAVVWNVPLLRWHRVAAGARQDWADAVQATGRNSERRRLPRNG